MKAQFKHYNIEDYETVCELLIELNRENQNHINWNWGRFEWMMEHPEFDKSLMNSIGLWIDGEKVVGAAIYDMYFGEAFCGVLPEYEALYPEILDYAYRELRDDNGLGISICDESAWEIEAAKQADFSLAEQTETIMSIKLDNALSVQLPEHFCITELDPSKEPYAFQWLLWQGFDHGTDREAFERDGEIIPEIPVFRKHFNHTLSIAAKNTDGEYTELTPLSDDKALTAYLWPIVREMIKTAIENDQYLIVEGCYIPFYWRRDFDDRYLSSIRFICLAMTDEYIKSHFDVIIRHESDIESRLIESDITIDRLIAENHRMIEGFQSTGEQVILISSDYEQNITELLATDEN